MAKQGKSPSIIVLNDDVEYYDALQKKLLEEVNEFLEAKNNEDSISEIADILEVIEAICVFKKYDTNVILDKKSIKKRERGGFQDRIFIIFQD